MFKKSIARIEKENESSQAELSNPALHDIIATNHVVLAKKPREQRLSRVCKALIIMVVLAVVAIGIIVLTLVLAHSRNTLMALVSRSIQENTYSTSNNSRILFINQENSTTVANEHKENENWSTKTTTVSLTSNNLQTLTTPNVHISSSVMRTEQQYERIPINTQSQSMKPYPSLNTIVNDQSTTTTTTVQTTTLSNKQTTFLSTSNHHQYPTTEMMVMTTINKLITTMTNEEDIQTSSDNLMTSTIDSTSTLTFDETTSIPKETTFITYFTSHFNIQSTTVNNTKKQEQINKLSNNIIEDDIMDDLLL